MSVCVRPFFRNSSVERFDEFTRETLQRAVQPITIPDEGTVFDYCVDMKVGAFQKWSERQMEKTRNLPQTYMVIPEVGHTTGSIHMMCVYVRYIEFSQAIKGHAHLQKLLKKAKGIIIIMIDSLFCSNANNMMMFMS